ncbi:MAG: hypothetical protein B6U97_01940 [Candidatus Altiarchaeales archaeon ex4484_96]|nr:MAG: hypothetical protein B6U97_01940 [Candidatus Altiarchaeales archaeon ex4484_96]
MDYEGDIVQFYLGAGMHGGAIYVRGDVSDEYLGVYASKKEFTEADMRLLEPYLKRYSVLFNTPLGLLKARGFTKIAPVSSRPFGKVYSHTPI